jgi:hypothetical protein
LLASARLGNVQTSSGVSKSCAGERASSLMTPFLTTARRVLASTGRLQDRTVRAGAALQRHPLRLAVDRILQILGCSDGSRKRVGDALGLNEERLNMISILWAVSVLAERGGRGDALADPL